MTTDNLYLRLQRESNEAAFRLEARKVMNLFIENLLESLKPSMTSSSFKKFAKFLREHSQGKFFATLIMYKAFLESKTQLTDIECSYAQQILSECKTETLATTIDLIVNLFGPSIMMNYALDA